MVFVKALPKTVSNKETEPGNKTSWFFLSFFNTKEKRNYLLNGLHVREI
jgi:hypothetical protein